MTREEVLAIVKEARSKGETPDLSDADLSRANLIGADLSSADLSSADLSRANLIGADLSDADLSGANIDFTGFDLACRSCNMTLDINQIRQMLHLVFSQKCDDPEYAKIRSRISPYVKRWSGLEKHNLKVEL